MSEQFPIESDLSEQGQHQYPSIEFNSGSFVDGLAAIEGAAGFVELSTKRTTQAFYKIRESLAKNLHKQGIKDPQIGLSVLGSRLFEPNYAMGWTTFMRDGNSLVPTSFDMPDISTLGDLASSSVKTASNFPRDGMSTIGNLAKTLGWHLLCVKDQEEQLAMLHNTLLHWHDIGDAIHRMRFGIRVHSEQIVKSPQLFDKIYADLKRYQLLKKAYLSVEISHWMQSPSEWIELIKKIQRMRPDLKVAASGDISHVQQSMNNHNMDGTAYETLRRIMEDPSAPEFSGIELHSWDGNSEHAHGSLQELNPNGLSDLFLAYGASAVRKAQHITRVPSNAIIETAPLSETEFLGTPHGASWLMHNVMDPYRRGFKGK